MFKLVALICSILTAFHAFANQEDSHEEIPLSTPDQIASLRSVTDFLVGGLVSPLSGQPVIKQTDLVVRGAQEFVLNRVYIPPHIPCSFPKEKHQKGDWATYNLYKYLKETYKGWQFFPHLELHFYYISKVFRVSDPNGMTLDFCLSNGTTALCKLPYAINNATGDVPSGRHDPRNTRIEYHGDRITVHAADGTVRIYFKYAQNSPKKSLVYHLEKEILPSGKVLKYHYQKNLLALVESKDPREQHSYASIQITWNPGGNLHFLSNTGVNVDYNYLLKIASGIIKKPKFEKDFKIPLPLLVSVSSPFFRNETITHANPPLLESFSGKNDNFLCGYLGFGSDPHYRVYHIHLPVGHNDALHIVHEISYDPPIAGQKDGSTTVRNSDGTITTYHFSKSILPTAVRYFGQDGSLKKEKIYSWTSNHWLKSVEIKDGQNILLSKKSYDYDRFGNPNLEEFSGDLTGSGQIETHTTRRTFSEDGRNLLLREEIEEGKVTCFSYLSNTNLITSKLTKDHEKIILREFSNYDDCYNLIQTISDDGAGEDKDDLSHVTQRQLTTYTLRQSAPFLHMPEWIEETYWENGVVKPLKKTCLKYDQYGNVALEEVYDAEGQHVYTLRKTYNERGDVLTETDCLGQEAVYTYLPRGHLETSTNFSHRLHTTFHYDTKGRLRGQTEKGDDGIVHATSSEYDFHDRPILKKDPFQNTTSYTYDPLVNKVRKTVFPSIASIDGRVLDVSTHSTHDPLGRELTQSDANGNLITYRYNAYGSPIEITHPDGGREIFRYAKNGQLASHTDPDGLTVQYKRDLFGRVLSKTYISDGQILAEETFTYNGFSLLTETDKEGNLKLYSYDGAGRKIRENFCGRVTDFSYDSLGWLATVCKYNDDNTLLTHYKRDLEGQILEEYQTDASGNTLHKISYSYDGDGNRKTITRYVNGKEAIHSFEYDSFNRLIEEKDAEGYITTTVFDENGTNPLGQKVLQTRTLDPCSVTTVITSDALSRPVKREIFSPQMATLSSREMTYDPRGSLLYRRDHVHEDGHFRNTQTVKYTYTPSNRIESLTRAFGTPDARTTAYTYFPSGKPETKTLPDGVRLAYSYHPLGFMSHLDSSDGKIHHAFEYDRLGYLQYARDINLDITIERKVDPFGNVTQETFPNGGAVNKDYDHFNRLISLKMGSLGEVLYKYDPLYLRTITRTSGSGEILYRHTYKDYDLDGNLLSEDLIGGLSQIAHTTGLRGQKTSISSSWFSQACEFDPSGNLIRDVTDQTEHLYSYDGLSQLYSENNSVQPMAYAYDSIYNRTQKNGQKYEVNDLNELLPNGQSPYDLNGNQSFRQTPDETFHFTYDPLNRLTEATSKKRKMHFVNDPLGRCLSKVIYAPTDHGWNATAREHYLYHGQNEIGAFASPDEAKNLRVLGLAKHRDNPLTVGVEIDGQVFAPILDVQSNIRRLIDLKTRTIADSYDFTAFGEELPTNQKTPLFNPWRFASKRLHPELGLIYFGKRYYDPENGRWLETDPSGFVDSINLYQYVFNNPFRYIDPDGRLIFALPLLALTWKVVAVAVVTAYVSYQLEHQHRHADSSFARNFNSAAHQMVQNLGGVSQYALNQKLDTEKKKKYNTNPFEGPVSGDVVVVDEAGNAINVPEGNWLTGTKDGKWIQERTPDGTTKGQETGTRKDGGHKPSPQHTDPRSLEPHGHVPEVTNPDGTPWLPIRK